MRLVSVLVLLPVAAAWIGIFSVQPVLAIVVLLSVIKWRNRQKRLIKEHLPDQHRLA